MINLVDAGVPGTLKLGFLRTHKHNIFAFCLYIKWVQIHINIVQDGLNTNQVNDTEFE